MHILLASVFRPHPFAAPGDSDAEELKRKVIKKFEERAPEFVTWLEENVDEGLTVFDYPRSWWRRIRTINGLERLSLTTNGVRLWSLAEPLLRAGVQRINVSLDSLKRNRFARITGQDRLAEVLAGIEAAEAAGMAPIKINTVVMRGVNDDEVADLAALTFNGGYDFPIKLVIFSQNHR